MGPRLTTSALRLRSVLRRALFLLPVPTLVSLAGCTSWRVQRHDPAALVRERSPSLIRVTRTDRTQVVLHAPAVVGDSLVGTSETAPARPGATLVSAGEPGAFYAEPRDPMRRSVPLDGVSEVALRRVNPFTTGLAVLGGTFVLAVALCGVTNCFNPLGP